MREDQSRRLDELGKTVERYHQSAERLALQKRAWDALDNAIGMVKMAHDMGGGTKSSVDLIEQAVKYLEGSGRIKTNDYAQPYQPSFLIHFAIALRAMTVSPASAQEMYKELGETFIDKYYK